MNKKITKKFIKKIIEKKTTKSINGFIERFKTVTFKC